MRITIELSEPAELQSLMAWLKANNFIDKVEVNSSPGGYENASWVRFSESTLDAIWNNPEEDYWDDLYTKQHPRE